MASVQRLQRLLRLIELLQSGRRYNTRQLSDSCRVSRRTVFRDLRLLQEAGLEVHFDDEQRGYTRRANIFLPPTDFTLDETLSLIVLCHDLGSASAGIPFQESARSAAVKLMSNLPTRLREEMSAMTELITVQLDAHNLLPKSRDSYQALTEALAARCQIRIRYTSLSELKEIITLLSPYRILFSRRSWYVIGRSSVHREVRTFNVGRITEFEIIESNYRIPKRFDLKRYLGNAWHLIRERTRHNIIVRFDKHVAPNVAEVQWHKSQEFKWHDDGSLDFHATVDGLTEIQWWILGYGDHAEVLAPIELRHLIANRIAKMSRRYARTRPSKSAKRRSGKSALKKRKTT